jgi:small subunit ribosomal protein S17
MCCTTNHIQYMKNTKESQSTTVKSTAKKRQFTGVVESVSESKTIRVRVKTQKMHKKYRKQYTESTKYAVHDEKEQAIIGNTVVFEECRPLSKSKRWRLISVIS